MTYRYYHTAEHINSRLQWLDLIADLADRLNGIELALWFHDAVYVPRFSNNEDKSARWVMDFLQEQLVSKEGTDRVCHLAHTASTQTNHESLVLDIDLSILGSNADTYKKTDRSVRFKIFEKSVKYS